MSEVRLIDANALISKMLNEPVKAVDGVDFDAEWFTRIADTAVQFTDMVKNAPTVDAVPVVHAHWEIVPNDKNADGYYKMRCSVCGETLWSIQSEELYCCKCGAKMDECADGERKDGAE